MAVKMMLAVLSLAAVTSDAATPGTCTVDAKNDSRPDYQFKTSLADRWCFTKERTFASCDAACCEQKKDLCENKFAGRNCKDANEMYDSDKAKTVTTDETADVDCCSKKKKCDYSCSSGWKNKANYATIDCNPTCSKALCCDKVDTCQGGKDRKLSCTAGWSYDSSLSTTTGVTAGNFNSKCCKELKTCRGWQYRRGWTCKKAKDQFDEHFVPMSKKDLSVADDDEEKWEKACCTQRVVKCSEYTQCNARSGGGWVHDLAKDNMECMLDEGFGSTSWSAKKGDNWYDGKLDANTGMWLDGDAATGKFCSQTCCKADKTKCRGYVDPHEQNHRCSVNYHEYKDLKTKAGNHVANDAAYRGACCSKKLSCQYFQNGTEPVVAPAHTSGQHTQVAAPFFVVIGVLALSQ